MTTQLAKFKWNRVYRTVQDDGSVVYEWFVFRAGKEIAVGKPPPSWLKDYADRVLDDNTSVEAVTKPDRPTVSLSETNHRYAKQCADRAGLSVDAWIGRLIGGHKTRKGWNR